MELDINTTHSSFTVLRSGAKIYKERKAN